MALLAGLFAGFSGKVEITEPFHNFKLWSQLTEESKGGYLTGSIDVPEGINQIEMSLFQHDDTFRAHPNLLFLSPFIKKHGEKPKDITAQDYKVILEIDGCDELKVKPLNYWPNKPSEELIGQNTWNKESRKIILGPHGLRICVLKPNEQGNVTNEAISVENTKKTQGISDEKIELYKVKLGVQSKDCVGIKFSDVILDKARFWIEPTEVPIKTICSSGEHVIYILHNSSIKQDTQLCLQLVAYEDLKEFGDMLLAFPKFIVTSTDCLISPNIIKFRIDMKDAALDELTGNQIKTTVNCFVDDEDVKKYFDHKKLSNNSPISIRIKQHKESNEGIPNEECPCIENGDNVRVFLKRSRRHSLTSARPKISKVREGGLLPTVVPQMARPIATKVASRIATGDSPAPRGSTPVIAHLNSIVLENYQSEDSDLESQLNSMSIRDDQETKDPQRKMCIRCGEKSETNSYHICETYCGDCMEWVSTHRKINLMK